MKRCIFSLVLLLCAVSAKAQEPRLQNSSTYPLEFLMVDSADHVTEKTGASPTVTLSKAGGSFASPAGAVTEIGHGWYKVAANSTDVNTLGLLVLHAAATGADESDRTFLVVGWDPFGPFPSNFSSLSIDSNGRVKAQTNYIKGIAINNYTFQMLDSVTHVPLVGQVNGDFTKKYRADNGAVGTLSGTITEIDSTNLPGIYQINLSSGELNGTVVTLRFKTSSSDETVISLVASQ